MPTYEYKCRKCKREFEVKQRISDDPLTECTLIDESTGEKCGGEVFRKISKNVGLIFNGHGFYQTDYVDNKSLAKASPCAGGACDADSGKVPANCPAAS